MATGGFAGSHKEIKRYAPAMADYRFYVAGNRNCTGTGHRMVKQAGGYLTHMENIWAYTYATPDYEDLKGERALVVRYMPRDNGIWVNAQGKRFHNEDLSGGATGTPAVMAQDPSFAWSVHDSEVVGSMFIVDPSYTADFSRMHEKKLKLLAKSPFIMKADSLKELAIRINVDPDTLNETVMRYNRFVEKGEDTEFGKKVKGLKKIMKSPYYAIQFFPAVRKTLGGSENKHQVSGSKQKPCSDSRIIRCRRTGRHGWRPHSRQGQSGRHNVGAFYLQRPGGRGMGCL